jgi:hypothetical protein
MMLRAVTNRDFPMLRRTLQSAFGMGVDVDTSLGHGPIWRFVPARFASDPEGRIRIIFVDSGDLSRGRARHVDVTGFNVPYRRLVLVGVPESVETQCEECFKTCSLEAYLLAIVFHELYEVLTGDFGHCGNPRRCINSKCDVYDVGTCSACMGALVQEKLPDIRLEDLYCDWHLANLKAALKERA